MLSLQRNATIYAIFERIALNTDYEEKINIPVVFYGLNKYNFH
mgnify:FL=1